MMHKTTKTRRSSPSPRRGFTLIEMLAVLFIMGILVALVVGVSRYVLESASRKETAASQVIVLEAVRAYYDDTGEYPPDSVDDPVTTDINEDGVDLLNLLKANSAATEKLRNLPAAALSGGDPAVKDAFGRQMRYLKAGGRGGKPVVISAGADGDFDKTGDNIRSDER